MIIHIIVPKIPHSVPKRNRTNGLWNTSVFTVNLLKKAYRHKKAALGAAYLAGLAVGYWKSTDDIRRNWAADRTFTPEIPAQEAAKRIAGWKKAVACAKMWAEN